MDSHKVEDKENLVEAEPCVVGIESSNNERWSGYNFPWTKELEELGKKLFVNFSLKPEKREVINATMSGRDVFAEMAATYESAVTYELPALLCPGTTVVVVSHPFIVDIKVKNPSMGATSRGLLGSMEPTEQQMILEELAKDSCEFKLLYVTADTITKSELLLKHLKTLYHGGLLARIVIEEVQSVSEEYKIPHHQGLRIFKKEFPKVPLLALASIATDSIRDEAVDILGLVNCIHFKKRRIHSRVSSSKQSEQIVAPSWMVEKSKIPRRQRRQTTLLQDLCLLNSVFGEHFLLDFKSGIDISIPLRVLLSKDILKDETTILKINWTDTQVGIDIEPRDPLTFQKLRSAAEQEHIKGSIKALLNAVRKTFDFGEIPIMVGHIIYPKFEREYEPIEEIGSGCFGDVFKCKVKLDDTYCAVKLIRFPASEDEEVQRTESGKKVQRVLNEVKMLSLAQHPNVVRYYQAWTEDYREPNGVRGYYPGSASYSPTRERMMYIHMELCTGSLKSKLAEEEELRTDTAWSYFRQILEALQFIHGKDIIHRDLKPDNIFIDNSGTVKIGDFGLALREVVRSTTKDVSSTTNSSPVGAYLYRAPEMKERDPNKPTNKVDMYALGLIVFQLFCPRRCSEQELLALTKSPEQECEEYKVDETAKPLILKLLQKKPSERPSAAELLQHLGTLEGKKQGAQLRTETFIAF